jgi:assimilatory nitrate reductase catalytic subunit
MATNPAHSMINYRKFETLIVSDFTKTLTTQDATIVLPACSWSEKIIIMTMHNNIIAE